MNDYPMRVGLLGLSLSIRVQLVSDAVSKGERVCWIDTLSQCPVQRFGSLLLEQSMEDNASTMSRYQVTSLAHFFALIAHLMDEDDGASTAASLVVVENISSLFTKEFPPSSDAVNATQSVMNNGVKREQSEKPADKRGRLIADIANRLQRLSASRMVATGIEDEKQQAFNAVTGAISMTEALENPEENGYDFSDDEEDDGASNSVDTEDAPEPSFPNELKRKRSNSSNGPASERPTQVGNPAIEEPASECSPVDLVHLPESAIDSGAGPFPILSQARGAHISQAEVSDFVPGEPTSVAEIPQKPSRAIVPDSDESEDDVF
ncbi:hypothetical protein ABW21_db0205973 [Orbilia brochopaga]|nr:hypothetical protein ABW21_db0205973 [Drechslerella brochopaga]